MGCSFMASRIIPLKNIQSPTGEYDIGTDIFHWVDSTRTEWFSEDPKDNRELMVQAWYPAIKMGEQTAHWLDNPKDRALSISENFHVPRFIAKAIDRIDTDTYINTTPIINGSYPVIIFSHGFEGFRTQNTTQIQELVSHGYVVFALDHTYDAALTIFPDGSQIKRAQKYCYNCEEEKFREVFNPQIETRVSDIIFLLDQIEKINKNEINANFSTLLDLDRIGIFGHSFGGGTSVAASIMDSRIKSCISLDGWYTPINPNVYQLGLNIPFIHLGRTEWEKEINYEILDSIFAYGNSTTYKLSLEGSHHYDFTDSPHLSNLSSRFKLSSDLDSEQILDATNTTVLGFFDKNLKFKSNDWLNKLKKNKNIIIEKINREDRDQE